MRASARRAVGLMWVKKMRAPGWERSWTWRRSLGVGRRGGWGVGRAEFFSESPGSLLVVEEEDDGSGMGRGWSGRGDAAGARDVARGVGNGLGV